MQLCVQTCSTVCLNISYFTREQICCGQRISPHCHLLLWCGKWLVGQSSYQEANPLHCYMVGLWPLYSIQEFHEILVLCPLILGNLWWQNCTLPRVVYEYWTHTIVYVFITYVSINSKVLWLFSLFLFQYLVWDTQK